MSRNPECGSPFRLPRMDEKTLNLWRQIEGARRIGKRRALGRAESASIPPRKS